MAIEGLDSNYAGGNACANLARPCLVQVKGGAYDKSLYGSDARVDRLSAELAIRLCDGALPSPGLSEKISRVSFLRLGCGFLSVPRV
jgi:hypothetical protein